MRAAQMYSHCGAFLLILIFFFCQYWNECEIQSLVYLINNSLASDTSRICKHKKSFALNSFVLACLLLGIYHYILYCSYIIIIHYK